MASVKKEIPSDMVSGNTPIEQLWYTWSDMGIDTIRAGYRIRAASPGLSDPNSAQVQRLNRYQRYLLPRGADVTISPSIAPVSLALINTGQERILIHKIYAGRDGVGRYGTFFVHLLASLPAAFSPVDAVSLWRSPFWRLADDMGQPNRSSTKLESISLDFLRQQQQNGRPPGAQLDAKIKKFLPYVIEAYLTKNLLSEKNGEVRKNEPMERQKLYIAAPDDLLASMISGLVHTLPAQLVQDLTFSTYESNVNETTTEIVGTCWISGAEQVQTPAVEQLLPASYYQEKLAINCYIDRHSELKDYSGVYYDAITARFALDATSYFLAKSSSRSKFTKLLDIAKKYPQLTISTFLDLYKRIVLRTHKPTQAEVEAALTPRYPIEYELSAENLSDPDYQEKLIELILTVPDWWKKYRPKVIELRKYSVNFLPLAESLHSISVERAYPRAISVVQEEIIRLQKSSGLGKGSLEIEARFRLMIDLMYCTTPPETEPQVWHDLLQNLCSIKHVLLFFHQYWNAHAEMMNLWSITFPPSKESTTLISPLLSISWERFGDFLTLLLPLDWIAIATNRLTYKSDVQPGNKIVADLERRYHPQIQNVLQQLTQASQYQQVAMGLFDALVQGGYQEKMQLLFLLLNSPMGRDEGKDEMNVQGLLAYAQLTLSEQALFLAQYGIQYLLDKKMMTTILNMFEEVAKSNLQQDKMRVLSAWLASPNLNSWFKFTSITGTTNFSKVLKLAHLTPQQSGEFLLEFGPQYIPLDPGSQMLHSLFKSYAQYRTPQRLTVLSIWLNCTLQQKILEQVLDAADLDIDERRTILLNYGEHYLALYPQSSTFLRYIQEFLSYLQDADITIFKSSLPIGEPSAEERLLRFLSNYMPPSPSADLAYSWYIAAQFVSNPSVLSHEWKRITAAIDWLTSNIAQGPTSMSLIKELAHACLPDKQNSINAQSMATIVLDVSSALTSRQNREQFLLSIAAEVRDDSQQKQNTISLFESCVLLAFRTKTMFQDKAEQENWVKTFLDTLFPFDDQRAFKDLSKRVNQRRPEFQADWQRYLSQRQPSTAPSRFRQARQYLIRNVPLVVSGLLLPAQTTPAPGGMQPVGQQSSAPSQTTLRPVAGQAQSDNSVSMLAGYTKHKSTILTTIIILLLAIMPLIYAWQASAHLTLTITAQNYSRPITLTVGTDSPSGALQVQEITQDFRKAGVGQATGTQRVGTTKSKTSVCFTNAGNATVEIPTDTIVSTDQGIQFTTTATGTYPPHSGCGANNLVTIPVQAVIAGEHENIAANSITTISDDSLAAIAKHNNFAVNSLHLTVTNLEAATGGMAKTAPAITDQDLNNVKLDLSDQLQGDITNWINHEAKDGALGQPVTATRLVNTSQDTTIGTDGTFNAEVDMQATIQFVPMANLQKAALSQLRAAISKDKIYSSYVIAENVKSPVSITQLKTQSIDDKSMKISFSAATVIIPPISKEDIQNMIAGKSPADAQNIIRTNIPAVQKADIQVTPTFFPWFVPFWPNRIDVTIRPQVAVDGLRTTGNH